MSLERLWSVGKFFRYPEGADLPHCQGQDLRSMLQLGGLDMWQFILTVVITAISLMIIAKLPLGIEVDGFNKALIAGLVFGVLNATVLPIFSILALPFTILTFGLFSLVVNALIFALAAALVEGFSLKNGFWSALLGTIVLSILNSVLMQIFNALF